MNDNWIAAHSKVDQAFETGSVAQASDSELMAYLTTLCTGNVPNPSVQHREIIRGITINHLQTARVIARLNRQNTILTWVVIVLAVASIIATIM